MTTQQSQAAQPRTTRFAYIRDRHRLYPLLIIFVFLVYWIGVYMLERVELAVDTFPIATPEVIREILAFFHPKVLRHLIPWIWGLFLAYQATVNLLWRLYDLADRQGAIDFLHRLRTPDDLKDTPKTVSSQSLEEDRKQSVRVGVGGPGRINIPIGMVAITEINGRFYRVLNSGSHTLQRFEFIHKIIDLRPQERTAKDVKFKTKDGFFVTADIGATYRVHGGVPPSPERPFPYDNDKVRNLAYDETTMGTNKVNDWVAMPLREIQSTVVGIISKLTLTDLVNLPADNELDPYLTVRLEHQARKKLAEKNIDLMLAWVNSVKLPAGATEQYLETWRVDEETQTKIILADGEAAAIEELEIARAEAEFATIQVIIEGINNANLAGYPNAINQIAALRLIEAMEKLAVQSQDVTSLPNNLIPQIHNLQKQLMLEGPIAENQTGSRRR